jgi:hypothetical protein
MQSSASGGERRTPFAVPAASVAEPSQVGVDRGPDGLWVSVWVSAEQLLRPGGTGGHGVAGPDPASDGQGPGPFSVEHAAKPPARRIR